MTVFDKIYASFLVPLANFWSLLTSLQFTVFEYTVDFGHLMVAVVVLTFFLSVIIKR